MLSFAKFLVLLSVSAGLSYTLGWWLWSADIREDDFHLIVRRQPALRSQDETAKLKARVDDLWSRIENQLKVISPKDLELLAPGCTQKELEDLEDQLGFALPIEARESLFRHNGIKGAQHEIIHVGGLFQLHSIEDIRKNIAQNAASWGWISERHWIENSNEWPTIVPMASSNDFSFNVECLSSKVFMGRSVYGNNDYLVDDWTKVLEAWAVSLEKGNYVFGKNGWYIPDWAGLNPY